MGYENTELSHVVQERAEGSKAPSQGSTLGIIAFSARRPVRGKSFTNRLFLKLLPLQGALLKMLLYLGCCPGLGAFGPSARS